MSSKASVLLLILLDCGNVLANIGIPDTDDFDAVKALSPLIYAYAYRP